MSKTEVSALKKRLLTSIPKDLFEFLMDFKEKLFESFEIMTSEIPVYDNEWVRRYSSRVELTCSNETNSVVQDSRHLSISYPQLMYQLRNEIPFGRCELHEDNGSDIEYLQTKDFLNLLFKYGPLAALKDYHWIVVREIDIDWDLDQSAFKNDRDHTLSLPKADSKALVHSLSVQGESEVKVKSRTTKSQPRAFSMKLIDKQCEDGMTVQSEGMPKIGKVVQADTRPYDDMKVEAESVSDDDIEVMLTRIRSKHKKGKRLNRRESSTRMQSEVP